MGKFLKQKAALFFLLHISHRNIAKVFKKPRKDPHQLRTCIWETEVRLERSTNEASIVSIIFLKEKDRLNAKMHVKASIAVSGLISRNINYLNY